MSGNFLPSLREKYTVRYFLLSLLVNAVVNTVIALILTAIGFGFGFQRNLIFSQCIGVSIYLVGTVAFPLYKLTARMPLQVLLIALAILTGVIVGTALGAAANGINPILFFRQHSGFSGQVVLIGLMFGVIVTYIFFSVAKLSEEKVKRLEAEKNSVEAELKLLESQMEPHFLFNTLSNVLTLIDTDRGRAREMLESFTSFLRTSLVTARNRHVTFADELAVARHYLALFQVRMGGRLRYTIDVPAVLAGLVVPPLIVQPLVENAIKHGLEPAPEGGVIHIEARQDHELVRISVADTGIGLNERGAGTGIGLGNIRKRLELAYNGKARLLFEENVPRGIRVVIEIPKAVLQDRT